MKSSYFYTILTFIIIGFLSRIIPHPPNFTAINAVAIFSFFVMRNTGYSILTAYGALFLSDMLFGFHQTMLFVYLSLGFQVLMAQFFRIDKSILRASFCLAISPLVFFVISNFGVWLTGSLYSKNLVGLELCYIAALPFLKNQVMGDLIYSSFLVGAYLIYQMKSEFKAQLAPES